MDKRMSATHDRVIVTGMGVISPSGSTIDEFWSSNLLGKSGVDYITAFDTAVLKTKIAGEVKRFDPGNYMAPNIARRADRFAQFGIAAAKIAIEDAGLDMHGTNDQKIGVVIGSGLGGNMFHEEVVYKMLYAGGPRMVIPSTVQKITPNSVSAWIAIAHSIKGPNYTISTACSSGTNAIGFGKILIDSGLIDVCLVGGAESPLTLTTVAAYESMGVLDNVYHKPNSVPRPFDLRRNGMVMAEGAACLVLEKESIANRRKASKKYGILLGYGANCGAYNMTAPDPTGNDSANAILSAIDDAGIDPIDIDYINAHGTGTQLNDVAETRAIKKVFGNSAYKIAISSTKSLIGHSIGASGAIEAIVCLLAMRNGTAPPTVNLEEKDPACDLDYVPKSPREMEIRYALSNSFGFGSNNAVLVFGGVN